MQHAGLSSMLFLRRLFYVGNFSHCNPTKLYFGADALSGLSAELPKCGGYKVLDHEEIVNILKESF